MFSKKITYSTLIHLLFLIFFSLGISQKANGQEQESQKKIKIFNKKDKSEKPKKDKTEKSKKDKSKKPKKDKNELSTIHLKNGIVLKGKITEQTKDSLKLRLLSNSQLAFKQTNIQKISNTPLFNEVTKKRYLIIDIGYTIGTQKFISDPYSYNTNNVYRGISLHGVGGRIFSPHLAIGAGVGFDIHVDGIFMPLHLDIRGDAFASKKATPTYYGGIGYGFLVNDNKPNATKTSPGGIFYTYGIGLKLQGNSSKATLITLGQQSQNIEWQTEQNLGFQYEKTWYNRMVIKLSFMFN